MIGCVFGDDTLFKICKRSEDVKSHFFFRRSELSLMHHEFKLVKLRDRLHSRKYFFGNRIVDEWNKLPDDVMQFSYCV